MKSIDRFQDMDMKRSSPPLLSSRVPELEVHLEGLPCGRAIGCCVNLRDDNSLAASMSHSNSEEN